MSFFSRTLCYDGDNVSEENIRQKCIRGATVGQPCMACDVHRQLPALGPAGKSCAELTEKGKKYILIGSGRPDIWLILKSRLFFFTFLQEFLKKNTLIASAYFVPHNNQRFLQSESFRPLFLKIKRLIWTDIRPILLADIQPAHSVSGQLPDMEGPNIMPAGYPVLPKLKHSLARRFSSKINY